MSNSIALPRLRTKRKKRKPPRPQFWWTLFWVIWCAVLMVYDAMSMFDDLSAGKNFTAVMDAGAVLLMYAMLRYWYWKPFKQELELWRKDDEE